jgi:mannitol/fructose-specific phosphotransferase system IIA component (Ntr-type)
VEGDVTDVADRFGFPVVDLPPKALESPDAAIKFLVDHLVHTGRLPAEYAARVVGRVLHRESLGSTGIGRGIALPHAKSDVVSEVLGVVGRSAEPVTWPGAADAEPVRLVCLLVTPASDPQASMRALEALSRRIRGE